MSSYSTPKDVQGYYLGIDFSKSDYLKTATIRKWIEEHSTATIDGQLRRKYTLPITNADDKISLKLLVEYFVVGKIDGIIRISGTEEEKEMTRNRNYSSKANKMLAAIMDGTIQFITSPKNTSPILYQQGSY